MDSLLFLFSTEYECIMVRERYRRDKEEMFHILNGGRTHKIQQFSTVNEKTRQQNGITVCRRKQHNYFFFSYLNVHFQTKIKAVICNKIIQIP